MSRNLNVDLIWTIRKETQTTQKQYHPFDTFNSVKINCHHFFMAKPKLLQWNLGFY